MFEKTKSQSSMSLEISAWPLVQGTT